MEKVLCTINKEKHYLKLNENNLEVISKTNISIIDFGDIVSIRTIKLSIFQMIIETIFVLIGFLLFFPIGLIIGSFLALQYYFSFKVAIVTTRGDIKISFEDISIKENFIENFKELHPKAFTFRSRFKKIDKK